MAKLTISTALHELSLIDSKIEKRKNQLRDLSVRISNRKPIYENQTEVVSRLIQSIIDLVDYKCKIKEAIKLANLKTKVEWEGKEYTLEQILFLKQDGGRTISSTFLALDDAFSKANSRVEAIKTSDSKADVDTVLHFDMAWKEREQEKHMSLMSHLNALIDQANIRTEIGIENYSDVFDK